MEGSLLSFDAEGQLLSFFMFHLNQNQVTGMFLHP